MKKQLISIAVATVMLGLSACSMEQVKPATKGKILSTSGYSDEILPPGKYTLWFRQTMVTIQTNTATYAESVPVVLADKLTLSVNVKFRGRIAGNEKVVNMMFNDITPGDDNTVSFSEVYNVYGKMLVRNKVREIVSQYTVEDVHKNYARLSIEIGKALTPSLKKTPLVISDITLGNIAYPDVVTKAINLTKERELMIKKEQAQAEIDLTKKKNEQLLAEAQYKIDITEAKAMRDKNIIIGEGITPSLLKLRALEVQEKMAENNAAVFMPFEAMSSVGAQVRMYNK